MTTGSRGGRPPRPAAEREFNQLLGERIGKLRRRARISAVDFARALEVKPNQLYWWETGRTPLPLSMLPRVARELDVTVAALLPRNTTNCGYRLQVQKSLLV